jgi:3-hydroxyacyl-[acyl-carrier-protein] dehydratase
MSASAQVAVVDPTPSQILALVPQQPPFRFVDEILELDDEHIVSRYRFTPEHDFYRGHFPGNPITPGVILIETMAQTGVVALGLYLLAKEVGLDALPSLVTMFTDVQADFSGVVRPGETVTVHARKEFFRRRKIRSSVELRRGDGAVVCAGTCSGMGVSP